MSTSGDRDDGAASASELPIIGRPIFGESSLSRASRRLAEAIERDTEAATKPAELAIDERGMTFTPNAAQLWEVQVPLEDLEPELRAALDRRESPIVLARLPKDEPKDERRS